jgi:flagellar motility protein MotE (MotC chaperone)
MKNMPRILPLAGLAVVGVLAVNFLAGARSLPDMLGGAKAFAEELAGGKSEASPVGEAPTAAKPAAVCAPTAAELARQANLSPAELRILQDLGTRRGQLDAREQDIDVQLQLLAAAEAKLDARVKALTGLKGDVQSLLGQADAQQEAELGRLVTVYSAMKAKDAAARFTLLDDSVRLPIAAKMKERTLAAILAQMPAAEAKRLTENLAKRFVGNTALASARAALTDPPAATAAAPAPTTTAAAKPPAAKPAAPKPQAARPSAPKPQAAAAPPAAKPPVTTPPAAAPTPAPAAKAG